MDDRAARAKGDPGAAGRDHSAQDPQAPARSSVAVGDTKDMRRNAARAAGPIGARMPPSIARRCAHLVAAARLPCIEEEIP